MAKVKACSELCVTLDTKDRDGNILMSVESVFRRCKEYSEELMNVENEREREEDRCRKVNESVSTGDL